MVDQEKRGNSGEKWMWPWQKLKIEALGMGNVSSIPESISASLGWRKGVVPGQGRVTLIDGLATVTQLWWKTYITLQTQIYSESLAYIAAGREMFSQSETQLTGVMCILNSYVSNAKSQAGKGVVKLKYLTLQTHLQITAQRFPATLGQTQKAWQSQYKGES